MTAAEQQHTKAVKETTKALTEQQKVAQRLRDIASYKISPVQPDMKIVDASVPTSAPKEKRPLTGEAARRSAATPPDIQAERDQRAAELRAEHNEKLAASAAARQAERIAKANKAGEAWNRQKENSTPAASAAEKLDRINRNALKDFNDQFKSSPLTNMLKRQTLQKPVLPNVAFPTLPNANPPGTSKHSQTINGTLIRSLVGSIAGSALAGPIGAGLGASYSGASAKFSIAIAAATAGLKLMREAIMQTLAAYERARQIYAKTVTSGFGTGMTVKRGMLAEIIGVSENDIFQFGLQIEYLNGKLSTAMRTITETQPALTATAWNFAILKENLKAIWATLAEAVAPAINRILELVSAFAKLEVLSGVVTMLGKAISFAIDSLTRLVAIAEIAPAAMMLVATTLKDVVVGLALTFFDAAKALVSPMIAVMKLITTAISDAFQWLLTRVENHLAKSWIGKKMGIKGVEETGFEKTEAAFAAAKKAASGVSFQNKFDFTKTKEAASAFKDVLKAAFVSQSPYKETAPKPLAYMKQMPASSWERMGLMIGGGGGTNYGQQTANHTKPVPALLAKIYAAIVAGDKFNISNPAGIPASP
jgi:hypothetical protein